MTTYRNLYHGMVRSMSEAIDLYDEGKGILAREVLKKPCWTQKSKSSRKISFPTNPSTVPTQRRTEKEAALTAASEAMPPRTMSAAVPSSHAPHDSKARLILVTIRRDPWRSHVHRTRSRRPRSSSSLNLAM